MPTKVRQPPARPRAVGSNFPKMSEVKFALHAQDPRARKRGGAKRRSAASLLKIAGDQARTWHPKPGVFRRLDAKGRKSYVVET